MLYFSPLYFCMHTVDIHYCSTSSKQPLPYHFKALFNQNLSLFLLPWSIQVKAAVAPLTRAPEVCTHSCESQHCFGHLLRVSLFRHTP